MDVKLIALDLDGTLLNSEKEIPRENYVALRDAAQKGALVVPCTGRYYGGMPDTVRRLSFVRYAITINGAEVYDTVEKSVCYRAELTPEDTEKILDRLEQLPVIYDCYLENGGYMPAELYHRAEEFVSDPHILRMIRELRIPVADFRGFVRGKSLQKIQMFFRDSEERKVAWEALEQEFPNLSITSSSAYNIEINHGNATKGKALLALCTHLGISPEATMAFGDSINDLSMIEAAGIGVAMGNALTEVKALANRVADTNDNAGVGKLVREIFGK